MAFVPDRLNRTPPIDEHDYLQGIYIDSTEEIHEVENINSDATNNNDEIVNQETDNTDQLAENQPEDIFRSEIEVTILGLNDEQKNRFNNHIEFWDKDKDDFYVEPNSSGVDKPSGNLNNRIGYSGVFI